MTLPFRLTKKTIIQPLRCSYDPNDKKATSTGESLDSLSLLDDALEYLIRFENMGNDTAFNVVIRDTLAAGLDPNSFELLGSSHPVEVTLRGGAIKFNFPNILLLWSDADPILSKGFVKYRIRPKSALPDNTLIENTAHIYFDYNPPIITNTTQNILVEELFTPIGETFLSENKCLVSLAPNPMEFATTFRFPTEIVSGQFRLFNAFGQKIKEVCFSGKELKLERGRLATGVYFYQIEGEIVCSGKLVVR